ncbi:hypothetical protein AB0D10_05215 [Kitasatospora sp. NPDC048545]|uniref:hypothetical protein n=1 Tax=Kitasatospora sp. NPDC048545 TaxID=3157208 RepID=UPI0034095D04
MSHPLARAALEAIAAAAQISIDHNDDANSPEAEKARTAARDAIDKALAAGVTSEEIWTATGA